MSVNVCLGSLNRPQHALTDNNIQYPPDRPQHALIDQIRQYPLPRAPMIDGAERDAIVAQVCLVDGGTCATLLSSPIRAHKVAPHSPDSHAGG